MQKQTRLVDTPLPKVADQNLLSMISELEHATHVAGEKEYLLWGYLVQCHYPNGAGNWFEIDKNKIIPGGLLSRKIGKLEGTAIYQVCDEVAKTKGDSIESVVNLSLYVFLNRYLPNFERKPKKRRHDPRDWL